MLNDVHEPPLEPEFADRNGQRKASVAHPVLASDGEPVADVELYHNPIPEHGLTGGIAMAVFAGILVIIFAAVMWVWM